MSLSIDAGMRDLLPRAQFLAASSIALAAYGESFIGGYPLRFDVATGAAMWQAEGTTALHRILLSRAFRRSDSRLEPVQALMDASGMLVSLARMNVSETACSTRNI